MPQRQDISGRKNNLDLCLRYLLSAIQSRHGAGFPDAVHKTLAWATAANLPTLTAGLVNRLKMIEQNFIPVLGDFHLIQEKSVRGLLTGL